MPNEKCCIFVPLQHGRWSQTDRVILHSTLDAAPTQWELTQLSKRPLKEKIITLLHSADRRPPTQRYRPPLKEPRCQMKALTVVVPQPTAWSMLLFDAIFHASVANFVHRLLCPPPHCFRRIRRPLRPSPTVSAAPLLPSHPSPTECSACAIEDFGLHRLGKPTKPLFAYTHLKYCTVKGSPFCNTLPH